MFAGAIGVFLVLFGALVILQVGVFVAWRIAFSRGWWSVLPVLGRIAPYIYGPQAGRVLRFESDVCTLREAGRLEDAAALATRWVADDNVSVYSRNLAIDILISAGKYGEALSAERRESHRTGAADTQGLALIQINLAEADYNLGRWDAAQTRLEGLDADCKRYPITWAGLLVQRGWIAVQQGRTADALKLCDEVKPEWFPAPYRAEYFFTRAAALLSAGRLTEAEAAVAEGTRVARRISSERNALFLRARIAAAREDWDEAERLCRMAAEHRFRGQGGEGLLLWALALRRLGRHGEADQALRLVSERDPESQSAAMAATQLNQLATVGPARSV